MRASLGWVFAMGLLVSAPGCNKQARHRTVDDGRQGVARQDHDGDGDIDERDRDPRSDDGSSRSAVRAIASARCEREARCKNLGVDAKYPSKAACVDSVRADWAKELNAYECPGGLNRAELNECLEDIRSEDCGSPFDTLARTLSCSKTEICAD